MKAGSIKASYLKRLKKELDQSGERLSKVQKLEKNLDTDKPPAEGFDGLTRQLLALGRLDSAGKALQKFLKHADETLGTEPLGKALGKTVRIIELVRARAGDAGLNAEQRKQFEEWLSINGDKVAKQLQRYMIEQTRHVDKARSRGQDSSADEHLGSQRYYARLRIRTLLASLPAGKRNETLRQEKIKLNRQIRDKEKFIIERLAPANKKKGLEGVEKIRLRNALAQLDSLRAERDGVVDYELNHAGAYFRQEIGINKTDYGFLVPQSKRDELVRSIQFRLTGATPGRNANQATHQRKIGRRSLQARETLSSKETALVGNVESASDWVALELARSRVRYLERRRTQLVLEDPARSRKQQDRLYKQLLEHDAKILRGYVAPAHEVERLTQLISGYGDPNREKADAFKSVIATHQTGRYYEQALALAIKSGDAQKVFAATVDLCDANLASETDAFVSYTNRHWYNTGLGREVNLAIGGQATSETLELEISLSGQLHQSLIRAAHRPIKQLDESDKRLLQRHGFIKNGKYVIPEQIKTKPTRVSSELIRGTKKGTLATLDRVVNAKQVGIIFATVAVPGAFAGRIGQIATTELLASRIGLKTLQGLVGSGRTYSAGLLTVGRTLGAHGTGLLVETAAFTGLSRAAQIALDPSILNKPESWTGEALGKEYLHNLAVLGALKVFGSGISRTSKGLDRAGKSLIKTERVTIQGANWAHAFNVGRAGKLLHGSADLIKKGSVIGEAALLIGLNSMLESNKISGDSYLENFLTINLMKGMHIGLPKSEGFQIAQRKAKINRQQWVEYWSWVKNDPGSKLMERFGGSWEVARKAYQRGDLKPEFMQQLFDFRKRVVDSLTAEIKAEFLANKDAKFGELKVEAFG